MNYKKFSIAAILFFFYYLPAFSQAVPGITIGGEKNEVGLSICASHDGGYVIAGSTRSYGNGSNNFLFVSVDESGEVKIERNYGWDKQDFFRKVIPVEGGYVFVGDSYNLGFSGLDIYMLKTDRFGYSEQGFAYGTNKRDNAFDIIKTEDNGFLILGHSRLENPKGDILLFKVNQEGEKLWQKSYWDDGNDYAFKIIKSSQDDGYVFVGSKNGFFDDVHADFHTHDADIMLIKIDPDGNELWRKTYGKSEHDFGYSVCNASDGGYYLLGSSQSYGNGSFDMLLIKTDEEGTRQWIKSFGGANYEYGKSIVMNNEGNLYLVGSTKSFGTEDTPDVYIVKTDPQGNEIWSETFGGTAPDYGEDVIALPNGGCAIAGSTKSFGEGGSDVYLLRLKANGDVDMFAGIQNRPYSKAVVFPNPWLGSCIIYVPDTSVTNYTIQLFDSSGRTVSKENFNGNEFIQKRGNLTSGVYFYKITSNKNPLIFYKGKLVVK